MATSGRIETGRYNGTCFYFQWQLGRQDVGTNRSVIHWQVGINITNNARWYSNAVRLNITTVNGSGNIASGVWSNISGNGDHQLGGGIMDIYHNSDGGKAFSAGMSGSLYGSGALETSGGWELPAIPRASSPTFTKGLYTVGETIAVNMNKKHWSFHHNVSIQIPDGAEIKRQDGFAGDQYVWTPTPQEIDTIYERMKDTRQTSLGVDTWTFNGGSMIGSGFQNVTIAVNDKEAAPLFSKIDARDTNAVSKAVTGNDRVFIQGISTVVATIADADKMKTRLKATPKSYSIKLVDKTATIAHDEKQNGKPYEAELGTISQKGSQRLVIQATDSRGLTAEAFKDLNFIEYDTPKITATAERKNNFENETKLSVSGTFARITVDGTDKNRIEPDSLRYRWKQDDGGWNAWIKRDFTQGEGAFTMTPAFLSMANSSKFIIEIEVRDKLSTSKTQISLDRGVPIMMISSSNRNVGIGKMPAEGRALDVKGKIYMNEKPLFTPQIIHIHDDTHFRTVDHGSNPSWTFLQFQREAHKTVKNIPLGAQLLVRAATQYVLNPTDTGEVTFGVMINNKFVGPAFIRTSPGQNTRIGTFIETTWTNDTEMTEIDIAPTVSTNYNHEIQVYGFYATIEVLPEGSITVLK